MRVLVLSYLYPRPEEPTRGIFVHEQVAALRTSGIDARVLSGEVLWLDPTHPIATLHGVLRRLREGPPTAFGALGDVPFATFRYAVPRGLWARLGAERYRAEALAAATRLHAVFPFELVHAHTALLDGYAGVALCERFGLPLVLTEHSGPFRVLTATSGMRRRTASAIAGARRGVAVSASLLRAIEDEVPLPDPGRWQVLPNGVDAARFARCAERVSPPDDGAIHALWIGHLVPIKRPELLVEAFARARSEEPRLRLALVGAGPLEAAVRARAAALGLGASLSLHPPADRAGVAAHLARSHFLVLASESESFGVVVIEALAAGKPVLSTRCGGPEEILTDVRLGLLVDADAASLAEGFVALAQRVSDGTAAGDAAWIRAQAAARFDFGVLSGRLRALYQEALTESAGEAAAGRSLAATSSS